jgi:D-3-phosphoglycerate dehydrogenase
MKIVIPDDAPPVYQDHPEAARLRELGELVIYGAKAASEEELIERLQGAAVVINVRSFTEFGERIVAALPDLRLVSVLGTGTDNFDLEGCSRHGVVVTNTPGASTVSVAELTLALMLSVARRVPLVDRKAREGVWHHPWGFELRGKVLGVVGLGLIGQEVARLGKALGMHVIAWSFRDDPARAEALGVERLSLDELMSRADVVSVHVRNSPEARGLIGVREIERMKPSAILINTARAAIVDQEALLAALREGRIAGAGLDVFLQEPLPPDHSWRDLDNVVLTPHVGWVTEEASARLAAMPVENILAYLAGAPRNVVNPRALEHPKQRADPRSRAQQHKESGRG